MRKLVAAAIAAFSAMPPAHAVSLNPDGVGQALVFPYYTVQSSGGNPFNTYLSVVNHSADAKAVRVRVRESRNGRAVASFNLFLAPNDMWTGAIVPGEGAAAPRLITADRSCVSPTMTGGALAFQNTFFSGTFSDSNGEGLDRTREGWVEMIEMATLTGASAENVRFGASDAPANCAAMQGEAPPLVAAPTGGLSGTLTLINVASGFDFTVNAEALADLGSRPFYRPPTDQYPDFNATEIDPVSVVATGRFIYRSNWTRAADAVSAVIMRSRALAEFVLDPGTRSRSDVVIVFPTRHHYANVAGASPPFSRPTVWSPNCITGTSTFQGEGFFIDFFDRETGHGMVPGDFSAGLPRPAACAAASVFVIGNQGTERSDGVLGSASRAGFISADGVVPLGIFQNGWLDMRPTSAVALASLSSSSRTDVVTGIATFGAHTFNGLPMMGLHVRTFENGSLVCTAGTCQGNYGGAFPLKFRRSITP